MKRIINNLPNRALSNYDLIKYVKLLKIKKFRGVFMRHNLPKKIFTTECGIINLDNNIGTHWTAYIRVKSKVVYFDSFGNLRPPLEVLKYFRSNGFVKIMYNYSRYQKFNSINCGHLCLKFLINNTILF